MRSSWILNCKNQENEKHLESEFIKAEIISSKIDSLKSEKEVQYGSVAQIKDIEEHEAEMEGALEPELDLEENNISQNSELESVANLFKEEQDVNTESGELRVTLNQTTSSGNKITFLCEFEDFYAEELIVQVSKNALAKGNSVSAKVTLKYGHLKEKVILEGRIAEIEEFDEKQDTLIIKVEKLNSSDYEKFVNLYQDRQNSIEDFMMKAKGF